jgi:hypothetical protein
VAAIREYIQWLLSECTTEGTPQSELLEDEAIDLLAARLRTPLQIEQHLSLAFEEAHRLGEKTVTTAVVEAILSNGSSERKKEITECNRPTREEYRDFASVHLYPCNLIIS